MSKKANYKAWSVSDKDFPENGAIEQKIRFLVQYGVLAPSTHNTQPWIITIDNASLNVKPDYAKSLPFGDPDNMGLLISIGAFVENIIQAAESFGIRTEVVINDDLATLHFTERNSASRNTKLLQAITERSSNKFWYRNQTAEVYRGVKNKLTSFEERNLKVIHESAQKKATVELHMSAAREAAQDKYFILEVTKWLRSNTTKSYEGMPGFVQGHSTVKSITGKFLAKTLKKLPPKFLSYEERILNETPFFVVFGSESNGPSDVIRAGMLVERFWLAITREGLVAQPLFAMIKSENHRVKLKKSVGMSTIPVFFLRVGLPAKASEHTPRRPFLWN